MECDACGHGSFFTPAGKTALQIWRCKACGHACAVRCHDDLDMSGLPRRDLFNGTATIVPADALKSLLKLKKALAFAERFDPAELEREHRSGKRVWNLGYFLDFEVERAAATCRAIGVLVAFERV